MTCPDTNPTRFVQAVPRDRASLTATVILSIVANAFRDWLYGDPLTLSDICAQIADILRDEFDDVKREGAGERIAGLE